MVERANPDRSKIGIIAISEDNHYMIVGPEDNGTLKCMRVAYGIEGEILHQGRIEYLDVNALIFKKDQVVDGCNVYPEDIEEILSVAARIELKKTNQLS